jgi:hypothetical protein
MIIVRRRCWAWAGDAEGFLISLVFGGLLAFFVGMILAMTQMRHIVRGEVQAMLMKK